MSKADLGAPETETPEDPKNPPLGVAKDRSAPLESPERPNVPEWVVLLFQEEKEKKDGIVDVHEVRS